MSPDIVQKEVNRAVSPEHSLCIDVSVPKIKQTVLTFKGSKHSFHSYVACQAIYGEMSFVLSFELAVIRQE